MHRRILVYVAAVVGLTAFILPTVDAQQTVEDFLKPQTIYFGSISNDGPPGGSDGNPAHPYQRVCTQKSAEQISCRKTAPKLESGGGDQYGHIYWIASDPPPIGYEFQSAKFRMPRADASGNPDTSGVRWCYGDDNSSVTPGVPSDPNTDWHGRKTGKGTYALCWINPANNVVMWYYTWQGAKNETKLMVPSSNGKAPLEIDSSHPGVILATAELDVVYTRIPTANAKAKPQSH